MNERRFAPGDLVGFSLSAIVVMIPVVIMVVGPSGWLAAGLAAISAGVGIVLAGLLWAARGRPNPQTMLRERTWLSIACLVLFVIGLAPTIVLS